MLLLFFERSTWWPSPTTDVATSSQQGPTSPPPSPWKVLHLSIPTYPAPQARDIIVRRRGAGLEYVAPGTGTEILAVLKEFHMTYPAGRRLAEGICHIVVPQDANSPTALQEAVTIAETWGTERTLIVTPRKDVADAVNEVSMSPAAVRRKDGGALGVHIDARRYANWTATAIHAVPKLVDRLAEIGLGLPTLNSRADLVLPMVLWLARNTVTAHPLIKDCRFFHIVSTQAFVRPAIAEHVLRHLVFSHEFVVGVQESVSPGIASMLKGQAAKRPRLAREPGYFISRGAIARLQPFQCLASLLQDVILLADPDLAVRSCFTERTPAKEFGGSTSARLIDDVVSNALSTNESKGCIDCAAVVAPLTMDRMRTLQRRADAAQESDARCPPTHRCMLVASAGRGAIVGTSWHLNETMSNVLRHWGLRDASVSDAASVITVAADALIRDQHSDGAYPTGQVVRSSDPAARSSSNDDGSSA